MKYIKLTFFVLFCSVLFSCSTTQTINVCGEPNSDIYSPEMVRLGTIDNSGNAKITLSSDGYYAYLLSKAPTSDKLIPFAIDYKNKNYTGTYLLRNVGMGISFAGCFSMFTGSLALLGGAEDIAATFFGIGGIIQIKNTYNPAVWNHYRLTQMQIHIHILLGFCGKITATSQSIKVPQRMWKAFPPSSPSSFSSSQQVIKT